MTGSDSWVSYSGAAGIVLAAILTVAAVAVAYAGIRLPLPARLPRSGRAARVMMLAVWVLAIVALVVSVKIYLTQVSLAGFQHASRSDPITPVTLTGVAVLFFVIALAQKGNGWRVALGSAVIGAAAAPWIFEVPFDLIIMPRSQPVIDPGLYRAVLFGTLIAVGITTLVLLSLSPAMRVRRATLWCLAGMLAVFAGWSLFGFSYPSAPGPVTLNMLSKILALVSAMTLFLPQRPRARAPQPALTVHQPRPSGRSDERSVTGPAAHASVLDDRGLRPEQGRGGPPASAAGVRGMEWNWSWKS